MQPPARHSERAARQGPRPQAALQGRQRMGGWRREVCVCEVRWIFTVFCNCVCVGGGRVRGAVVEVPRWCEIPQAVGRVLVRRNGAK